MSDDGKRSAFLDDQKFAVEEGAAYRLFRTGAIWMNKLFFGAITLLAVWLFLGLTGAVDPACTTSLQPVMENGTHSDATVEHCSVWLSPTAMYLGAMSGVSFTLSILFGFFGLVVGKSLIQMTPRDEELAAQIIAESEEESKPEQKEPAND